MVGNFVFNPVTFYVKNTLICVTKSSDMQRAMIWELECLLKCLWFSKQHENKKKIINDKQKVSFLFLLTSGKQVIDTFTFVFCPTFLTFLATSYWKYFYFKLFTCLLSLSFIFWIENCKLKMENCFGKY